MYIKSSANVVVTKLRAMYGRRLQLSDYNQLVNKYSISEVAHYLKYETQYSAALESINEKAIHRGQLELLVKIANFERYIKFLNYKVTEYINVFRYIILKNELEQMLTAIRLFNTGKMEKYAVDFPVFLIKYTKINLKELAKVKSFDDLLNVVKGTIYYKHLKKFEPRNNKIDVVRCETELRKAFYYKMISFIDKKDDKIRSIFLMVIDIFNISVIYRLKKFFYKDQQYIKSCLLPFFYYLNESIINKMISCENIDDLYKIILTTKYCKYFKDKDLYNIDFISNKILYNILTKDIKFINSPEYTMICHVYLMDIELKNIITVIECIGYKFSPEEIKKLLII